MYCLPPPHPVIVLPYQVHMDPYSDSLVVCMGESWFSSISSVREENLYIIQPGKKVPAMLSVGTWSPEPSQWPPLPTGRRLGRASPNQIIRGSLCASSTISLANVGFSGHVGRQLSDKHMCMYFDKKNTCPSVERYTPHPRKRLCSDFYTCVIAPKWLNIQGRLGQPWPLSPWQGARAKLLLASKVL